MKIKHLFITTSLLLLLTFDAVSQVTIGSNEKPLSGSLLDLKEQSPDGDNVTSTRGLNLPRVNLSDINNLYPMFEGDSDYTGNTGDKKNTQDAIHTGLTVYHTDKCSMLGSGVYVWNGLQWNKLGRDQSPGGLNLSPNILYFPSGQDLRAITAQEVNINWNPSGSSVTVPTFSYNASDFTSFSPSSFSGLNSPQTLSVQPSPLTDSQIMSNPFATADKLISFTFGECNQTKTLTINQTNKALLVDGSTSPAPRIHTVAATNQLISVQSNAQWKLSVTPALYSPISGLTPDQETIQGSEHEDGTSTTNTQSYDIAVGANLQFYNLFTFSDAQRPKRFKDVVLTVLQCNGEYDLTMEQYKDLWEEMYGLIDGVDEPDSDGDITKNPNRVRWHYDQSGNIFFSAVFGTSDISEDGTNRWMVNNLSARRFDPVRTATDVTIVNELFPNANWTTSRTMPRWAYVLRAAAEFAEPTLAQRQRIGIAYNWAAATNSKAGTTTGIENMDNPGVIRENDFPEGDPAVTPGTQKRRQGICPAGWHLPSDWEWTKLENEIQTNTSKYSSSEDIGGEYLPLNFYNQCYSAEIRVPMIDMCEKIPGTYTSYPMLNGGFSALLVGGAIANDNYTGPSGGDQYAYFWTSSSGSASYNGAALNRTIHRTSFGDTYTVGHFSTNRVHQYSVRCVKD